MHRHERCMCIVTWILCGIFPRKKSITVYISFCQLFSVRLLLKQLDIYCTYHKNIGWTSEPKLVVGCQNYCCCLVAKLCPTLLDYRPHEPYSLPGSSVHGIFQARKLGWVAISSFRGSPWLRGQTCVSCISRWIFYHWATRKGQNYTTIQINRIL